MQKNDNIYYWGMLFVSSISNHGNTYNVVSVMMSRRQVKNVTMFQKMSKLLILICEIDVNISEIWDTNILYINA